MKNNNNTKCMRIPHLARRITLNFDMSVVQKEVVIQQVFQEIKQLLQEQYSIQIKNFGTFKTKKDRNGNLKVKFVKARSVSWKTEVEPDDEEE